MSVVAPITVAWQGVTDSVNRETKQVETFEDLSKAVNRAQEVNQKAESIQNSDYAGSDPKSHITIHPGAYQYGGSIDENTDLEDVFITILPGALVTDSLETFSSKTSTNIADLNSFAETAFFAQENDAFVFDSPVRFKDKVVFQENTFPVKSIEGGKGISVSSSFGDVTINHSDETGGASENLNENSFLNEIQFDEFGHVEEANFANITTGVGVENDGTGVLELAKSLNFSSNLSVTDDNDGTATVEVPGTEEFQISTLQNLFPIGDPLSKTSATSGSKGKFGVLVSDFGYSRNDIFENSGETEKGIISPSTAVSGTLNPQVEETDLHKANIFAKASEGNLKLVLNGANLITLDLSSTGASVTETSNSGASSLFVSESSPLLFPNRETFNQSVQRTGGWEIGPQDLNLGMNALKIVHEIGGESYGKTQEVRYFVEDTDFQINVGTPSFSVGSTSGGVKKLSGVKYNKEVEVDFSIDIDNVYRNTFSTGNAISFPVSEGVDYSSRQVPELSGSQTEDFQLEFRQRSEVLSERLVLDSPTTQLEIEDPVEGKISSSQASNLQLLLDSKSGLSSGTFHAFETEKYRLNPNEVFDTVVSPGEYDSTKNLQDGASDYQKQLQVTDGKIVYPSVDYSQISEGPPSNPNYSENVSGERTYYGIFTNEESVSNFVLKVKGTGEIVSPGSLSTGTQVASIEIKAPSQTPWLDVNNYFTIGSGGGAYQPTNAENPKKTIGPDSEIGLTIGKKDTVDSFNRIYYRITAPEGWTGEITEMDISWGIS